MTFDHALELILGNLGVLVLLLIILVGGARGWWVYGRYYEDEVKRNLRLEEKLERATRAAEYVSGAADRVTRVAERTLDGSSHDG